MSESSVAVILAEGASEKTFLSALIQNSYGFVAYTDKSPICFTNPVNKLQIWFFPVPALGKAHSGGSGALVTKDPYIKAEAVLASHPHILSKHPDFHYYILTDTDGSPEKKIQGREAEILSIVEGAEIEFNSLEVHFPNKEIEVWMMAGLTENFPNYAKNGWATLKKEINRLEQVENPKEFLDSILDPSLAGNRMAIGARIGASFNIKEAQSRSVSFRKFIKSLSGKGLL